MLASFPARSAPFVATKTSDCGTRTAYCRRPIVRGDIVVLDESGDGERDPEHIEHWIEDLERLWKGADAEIARTREVAYDVLGFCTGLSAVDNVWIENQYRRLEGPR